MRATVTVFGEDHEVPQVIERVKKDGEVMRVTDDRVPRAARQKYEVYHQRKGHTQFHEPDAPESSEEFEERYVKVAEVYLTYSENNVENIFSIMQGERWCDWKDEDLCERVQDHIKDSETHTSMSVGDMVKSTDEGKMHMVQGVGFLTLHELESGRIETSETMADLSEAGGY